MIGWSLVHTHQWKNEENGNRVHQGAVTSAKVKQNVTLYKEVSYISNIIAKEK
jgi:hypothetical protein